MHLQYLHFTMSLVMELFRRMWRLLIELICLLPWLQHAVFACQLVSYLATLGDEMVPGKWAVAHRPKHKQMLRSRTQISKETILAVALSEKPVCQRNAMFP